MEVNIFIKGVMRKSNNSIKQRTPNNLKQLTIGFKTIDPSNAQAPAISNNFFDITYIFSDPFSQKNHRKYSKQMIFSATKTPTSRIAKSSRETKRFQQSRQSNIRSPNVISIEQTPIKGTLNIQKTNLLFDDNGANEKIHSKRKVTLGSLSSRNNKSFRESQKWSENNKSLAHGVLTGKSYNTITDTYKNPENQRKQQHLEHSIENLATIKHPRNVNKHIKFEQSNEIQKRYSNKDITWAKSAMMMMRNKQSLRVYRPWSPQHLDRQSNIYDQNTLF